MSRSILQDNINSFDPDKFIRFFREKNRSFTPLSGELGYYNDESFSNGKKLGEISFSSDEVLTVCAFKVQKQLSERSGKKAQYEKTRKILKDAHSDAGIFIFYDKNGNFRFSLVHVKYKGRRRDWSSFRRFTYFVSSELTNKTFLQRIGASNFSSLEKIKDAFSVEKVTKEFYRDIAYWYFWAVQNCRFPKDAEQEENGRNIAVIRLITRLIFIWFMRERGLVPNNLFQKDEISNYLKNLSSEESTYYKAILQNLFFATLSTKQEERKYASEKRFHKGWNEDYGNQYVFRYHELFKAPGDLKKYFGEIPFLNGGLFECLDDKRDGKIIDGFSRTKKNQPNVPNFLFFSNEQEADLNKAYGTKNKKYKVRGLIDILSSYNFTIDENDPNDAEVALDPELLGKVFENLLASFNPETSTTARNDTASFYTPREIVDYMVTQSLSEYLKTHLDDVEDIDKKLKALFFQEDGPNSFNVRETARVVYLIDNIRIVDPAVGSGAFPMGLLNRLVYILSKLDPENRLWQEAQIKAVEEGITDPSLKRRLKEEIAEQFSRNRNSNYGRKLYLIQKCIYGVDIQQIAVEIAKLRFFISLLVDENIDRSRENWGIEPLPNLDFKIMQGNSLISEFMGIDFDDDGGLNLQGKIDDIDLGINKINDAIKSNQKIFIHLLNTEGKKDNNILQNSDVLAGKKKSLEKERDALKKKLKDPENEDDNIQILIQEFQQKKSEFQSEPDRKRKEKLKDEINDLIIEIFEARLKTQKADYFRQLKAIDEKYSRLPNKGKRDEVIAEEKRKIYSKSGFDLEKAEKALREFTGGQKVKPFFAWRLYFAEAFQGERPGFDIVIGNPPYIQLQKNGGELADLYKDCGYRTFARTGDIYALFYEKGLELSRKEDGCLCYISSNKWMRAAYGEKLRAFFAEKNPLQLLDFGGFKVFEGATVDTNIIITKNSNNGNRLEAAHFRNDYQRGDSLRRYFDQNMVTLKDLSSDTWFIGSRVEIALKKKIKEKGVPLKNWDVKINFGIKTGCNEAFIIDETKRAELIAKDPKSAEIIKPIVRGRDIKRYGYDFVGLYLLATGFDLDVKNEYSAVYDHLKDIADKIKNRKGKAKAKGVYKRDDQGKNWWNLRACIYYPEFEKDKIVWKRIGSILRFAYDSSGTYALDSNCIATGGSLKFLTGVLNSSMGNYLLQDSPRTGTGDLLISVQALEPILVPLPPKEQKKAVEGLVDQILSTKQKDPKADTTELENQIDIMVYELYGLTDEEIAIVEGKG